LRLCGGSQDNKSFLEKKGDVMSHFIKIKGDLDLRGAPIIQIPSIKVLGSLDISYTRIKSLPNMEIAGDLYLEGTDITELHDGVLVQGKVFFEAEHRLDL
jgi:hypothetical protein